MKRSIILISLMCMFMAGCSGLQNPQDVAALSDQVNIVAADLQEAILPLVEKLNAQGIVSDTDKANIGQISAEVDRVQAQVADISQAIKDSSGGDVIDTLQAVNAATAPYNPWSMYINVGLGIVGAVLGVFAKKKTDEANSAAKALGQTVQAIQAVKSAMATDTRVIDTLKTELSKAQDTETKQTVALIKTGM